MLNCNFVVSEVVQHSWILHTDVCVFGNLNLSHAIISLLFVIDDSFCLLLYFNGWEMKCAKKEKKKLHFNLCVFVCVSALAVTSEAYFSTLSKIGEKDFHTKSSRSLGMCTHTINAQLACEISWLMSGDAKTLFLYLKSRIGAFCPWCVYGHLLNKSNTVPPNHGDQSLPSGGTLLFFLLLKCVCVRVWLLCSLMFKCTQHTVRKYWMRVFQSVCNI